MAGDRTLKLSLLADTKNLVDGLKKGGQATESFGEQIGDISAKVLKSFAVIGTAVAGFSAAFAKAAAEDEMAANKLAQTIGSVTKATEAQIAAVGDYITQTSIATGITDDELRPAYERLVRSTKDVDSATKLLNLSLDLSAATGKPLEAVANALGRAYDGNTTALGRLGLGIDASLLKSKDFNAIYQTLNRTFGEFSEKRSEEAIVKFQRLQVAIDEAKESVGAALLPVFERLSDWLLTEGVPRLNAFIAGLTGDKSLSAGFTQAQRRAENFGEKTRGVIDKLIEYKEVAIAAAAITASIWAVTKIQAAVVATIGFINLLIKAYNALKTSAIVAAVASRMALNPLAGAAASAAVLAVVGLAAKAASEFDEDAAASSLTYNERVAAEIASRTSTVGGGGFGGGGGGGGGGGVAGGGGGGSTSGRGRVTVAPAPTIIEQVSAANAERYFGTPTTPMGVSDVRQREIAADLGRSVPTTFDVAAARRGEEASMAGITINVNAPSMMDEEGFKRAMVNALNESANRGTGGGGALRFQAQVL